MTAIEEMAGMDVLCSDKTGTLTLNKLSVDKNLIEVSLNLPMHPYECGFELTLSMLYSFVRKSSQELLCTLFPFTAD